MAIGSLWASAGQGNSISPTAATGDAISGGSDLSGNSFNFGATGAAQPQAMRIDLMVVAAVVAVAVLVSRRK